MATESSRSMGWAERWMATVTDGSMTQRRLTSVERYGGVAALKKAAKAQGIHLLQLTDDHGNVVVAASRHPFKVLC